MRVIGVAEDGGLMVVVSAADQGATRAVMAALGALLPESRSEEVAGRNVEGRRSEGAFPAGKSEEAPPAGGSVPRPTGGEGERVPPKVVVTGKCVVCGGVLPRRGMKCCSDECRAERAREKQRKLYKAKGAVSKPCADCGAEMEDARKVVCNACAAVRIAAAREKVSGEEG